MMKTSENMTYRMFQTLVKAVHEVEHTGHEPLLIAHPECLKIANHTNLPTCPPQGTRTTTEEGHRDQETTADLHFKIVALPNQTLELPLIRSVAPRPQPAVVSTYIATTTWRHFVMNTSSNRHSTRSVMASISTTTFSIVVEVLSTTTKTRKMTAARSAFASKRPVICSTQPIISRSLIFY